MSGTLLSVGIACIIGAIVGGGLKAFGIEIPALSSVRRQILLGGVGVLLVLVAIFQSSGGFAQPGEKERRLITEVSHRAHAALNRLGNDEQDVKSGTGLYPPEDIYYNVTRFLNNSFPDVPNAPDYSFFPENKGSNFEALIAELMVTKGKTKPLQSAWDAFKKLDNLASQKAAQLDKGKSLEAVANARKIITNEILTSYFKSSIE